ncbi:MAG: nucleotidyltransferase domain-containing protein [Muribaculaceae bacterium]|nr:nucleotidyltransferase domain-containing protein [Muribaculaceae bacterium]MDE6027758.1 nucleotidyltransferase domain-containing protein [Muribaculaceae bacterium]
MPLTEQLLHKLKTLFSTQPVEKAWIFGSFARGEETDSSDIDIMVSYLPESRLGLFGITRLKLAIEDIVGRKVDLVERGRLFPRVQKEVENQKVIIYER